MDHIVKNPEKINSNEYMTCTLCDVSFASDVTAMQHCRGYRHRLNFKKKVDSSLQVETKTLHPTRSSMSKIKSKQNGKNSLPSPNNTPAKRKKLDLTMNISSISGPGFFNNNISVVILRY